jgi:hypothetical protein
MKKMVERFPPGPAVGGRECVHPFRMRRKLDEAQVLSSVRPWHGEFNKR